MSKFCKMTNHNLFLASNGNCFYMRSKCALFVIDLMQQILVCIKARSLQSAFCSSGKEVMRESQVMNLRLQGPLLVKNKAVLFMRSEGSPQVTYEVIQHYFFAV